jgi:hypothetical protein
MLRRGGSYEARVLLVPVSQSAWQIIDTMRGLGLEGVMALVTAVTTGSTGGPNGAAGMAQLAPIGERGWAAPPPATTGTIPELVSEADMVVLVVGDPDEVHLELAAEVAEAARDNGDLVAATLVGSRDWQTPEGKAAMSGLREAVDMLVSVRQPHFAASFIDVLRGGRRAG